METNGNRNPPTLQELLTSIQAIDPATPPGETLALAHVRQAEALTLIGLELHHIRRTLETATGLLAEGVGVLLANRGVRYRPNKGGSDG